MGMSLQKRNAAQPTWNTLRDIPTIESIVDKVLTSPYLIKALQEAIAECSIEVRANRSNIIRAGLERARMRGLKLGRPSVQNLINTPLVLEMRMRGASLRTIATDTGYSHGTIQRLVKRAEQSGLLLMEYIEKEPTPTKVKTVKASANKRVRQPKTIPKAGTMPYDLRPFMSKK